MKQVNVYLIFNKMKQQDLLVEVFTLVKITQTKLRLIKPIHLIINLDQDPKKIRLKITSESINAFYEGCKLTLNAVRSGIFPIKEKKNIHAFYLQMLQIQQLKILAPKQMLQRVPIALA